MILAASRKVTASSLYSANHRGHGFANPKIAVIRAAQRRSALRLRL